MVCVHLAGKAFEFPDESLGGICSDELGGLNGVNQKFQLGQFKFSGIDIVADVRNGFDVHAEFVQDGDICVYDFAFRIHAVFFQVTHDIVRGDCVVLVGIAQQNFHDIERAETLGVDPGLGHTILLSCRLWQSLFLCIGQKV